MMALLYPRSKNLQSHLSEYFIVVVRLCHQLLKFTQKSIFGQFASTLSDSDMKIYQSELDLWANTIKEEVNLLIAKKIEEEAEENSRFRALSSNFSKYVSSQQKIETNLRLLNICSMYDYETTWKQTRKVGNATLFNQNTEYQNWKGQADSCTLIYTGKLGSGKSVLLANIVDNLNLYIQSKNVVVAYFFCRHDSPESLKARTVIGSLARQLLRPIPDLTIAAELLDETSLALDFERIFSLLQRALPPNCKAYFILDGLDECDYAEGKALIQQLRKLQEIFTLLLCVSFRLEPNNALI
jgi:ankyrin repeat domain-containing protein 50